VNDLDGQEGFRMLRRLLALVRSKRATLIRESDLERQIQRLEDDNAMLREQLEVYRDTLASFQAEQNLRGALAKADLMRLSRQN